MEERSANRIEESIGSGVDAILDAAREAAQGIVSDAERRAEDVRAAVEAYAERVRREAEDEARGIRAAAEAEGERLRAAAEDAARSEAAALTEGNAELRNESTVLASRRERLLRDLDSLAHDLEDAIAELAPEGSRPLLGEALDVRRRP